MIGKEIPVPPGLKEEPIDHAVDIVSKQFANDKAQRYIMLEDLVRTGRTDIDYEFNKEVFSMVIPDMVKNGGRCLTVEGSGIASIWDLHAVTENYHPVPGHPSAVTELNVLAHEARKPRMAPHCKGVLHLFLLANDRSHPSNDPSRNAKVSDVLRPVMQMARENAWTIALEATSERSRDIYQHLGFDLVKELIIGVGKADSEGRAKEGGEGVRVWAMMTPV